MLMDPYGTSVISKRIIACAIRVHDAIGPGVYESVYHECMAYELEQDKLEFELERKVPLIYRGTQLKSFFYIDIVVERRIALELKAQNALTDVHQRQVLTQLRLAELPVGLLINFNVARLVDGVKRIVNSRFGGHHENQP